MENKYYTPKIEEFHVGFEYEWFNPKPPKPFYDNDWELPGTNGEWAKKTFDGQYDMDSSEQSEVAAALANYDFNPTKVRVKCLDREDIESLGWKFIESHKQFPRDYFEPNLLWKNTYSDDKFDKLEMFTDYSRNVISIKFKGVSGNNLFRGFCKNKFELKKLMAQLGIAC